MSAQGWPDSEVAQIMDDPNQPGGALAQLNKGERQCLDLVGANLGSKEIARRLNISPHTVDARLKSACSKLGTNSRFVAARMLTVQSPGADDVTVTSAHTNLVYQSPDYHDGSELSQESPSAGEGDGSDDLDQRRRLQLESKRDSGFRTPRLEASGPYATFFGGENRFSIGKRLAYIAAIAIGIAIAFGGLTSGLLEISRMLTSH